MKQYAETFYKSKAWQKCREAYAKSRRGLCELCLAEGQYTPGVIVHHKTAISPDNITDPQILLDWSNLQLVCRRHHAELHSNKEGLRYKVDDLGRVIL